jgi:hypothetical protein
MYSEPSADTKQVTPAETIVVVGVVVTSHCASSPLRNLKIAALSATADAAQSVTSRSSPPGLHEKLDSTTNPLASSIAAFKDSAVSEHPVTRTSSDPLVASHWSGS